jgi:hypothetical protein
MSELQADASATPKATTPALVIGVFGDEVRAEQAARALEVWRHANRRLGIGPVAVVARHVSGTVTWRIRGVVRPRRGALVGLLTGIVLFALPAAGAAALATWVVGSLVLGLAGLVGFVSSGQAGWMVLLMTLGGAGIAAVLAAVIGAALGALVGLVVGMIDARARGLDRSEVTRIAATLDPGGWAAAMRAQPDVRWLVGEELTRLGGAEPAKAE